MLEVKKGQLWKELRFNWSNRNTINCETTIWYLLSDPYERNYDHGYEKEIDAISLDSNFRQSFSTRMFFNMANWKLICEE